MSVDDIREAVQERIRQESGAVCPPQADTPTDMGGKAYAVLWRTRESGPTDPCPWCGRRHWHGAGDGPRVPHCDPRHIRVGEYHLPSGQSIRASDGYMLRTRVSQGEATDE
ncbi:hypothetical protein [Desulfatirhabdium butyrativorans]|uniref:hypothetical protein n=1 Tax=Desulfatirhabdium butyrativorans TaxID=340467 RepID=UPI0004874D5C|nr:hypothetical protein [Desulfatirhabdium butyrativorans]